MRFSYWKGYNDGRTAARTELQADFERVLAVLREELVDARRYGAEQAHRADAACDLLLGHLGARAISLEGEQREGARHDRHANAVRALSSMPDPTEDLPIGHPLGLYATEAEARFDAGEDAAGFMVTTDG